MRKTGRSLPKVRIWLLVTTAFLLFSSGPFLSAAAAESAESDSSVEQLMAGLSEEQVRQLLIDELKKDAEEQEVAPQKMKGPALLLARLLRIMRSQHDDSENEVRAMFSSLPTLGPDLYRVFIKL